MGLIRWVLPSLSFSLINRRQLEMAECPSHMVFNIHSIDGYPSFKMMKIYPVRSKRNSSCSGHHLPCGHGIGMLCRSFWKASGNWVWNCQFCLIMDVRFIVSKGPCPHLVIRLASSPRGELPLSVSNMPCSRLCWPCIAIKDTCYIIPGWLLRNFPVCCDSNLSSWCPSLSLGPYIVDWTDSWMPHSDLCNLNWTQVTKQRASNGGCHVVLHSYSSLGECWGQILISMPAGDQWFLLPAISILWTKCLTKAIQIWGTYLFPQPLCPKSGKLAYSGF